jgi:heparan-alpha-glucosaminide N-acetyltransferase
LKGQANLAALGLETGPSPATASSLSATPGRLASLDIYRGLVIVVMTLVNYLSPVQGVPAWSKHWPEALDGYTYVDVVFPAFLFIVGVAIPFALGRRLSRGDSSLALIGKILARSAVLILLGVITVNPHYFQRAGPLSEPWWFLLVMVCALAVWNAAPAGASPSYLRVRRAFQVAGGAGLVVLLALFRGTNDAGQTTWLHTAYWGMLGMIGWAYLVASLCWLALRKNAAALMGAMGFMLCFYIGIRQGALHCAALGWLGYSPKHFANAAFILGSNPATVMMGVLAGNCLLGPKDVQSERHRLRFLLLFGVGLYAAGMLLRPLHGINKSDHTAAYALVTGGISCVLFALVYWGVDVKGWWFWNGFLTPLGQNALLAYILPEMVDSACAIFGLSVYWSKAGLSGELSAVALTVALLTIMWLLTRARLVMKL